MSRPRIYLAAESYEARVERRINRPDDLYDLDGETFVRFRDGRVETCDAEAIANDDWS